MMRHITIQEISSRFPDFHDYLVKVDKNNNNNIFFIDQQSEGTASPIIYLMWCGEIGILQRNQDGLKVRIASERLLKDEALAVAKIAVANQHPYLIKALNNLERVCSMHSLNSLF